MPCDAVWWWGMDGRIGATPRVVQASTAFEVAHAREQLALRQRQVGSRIGRLHIWNTRGVVAQVGEVNEYFSKFAPEEVLQRHEAEQVRWLRWRW